MANDSPFLLAYAGIPFCLDVARVVRIDLSHHEAEAEEQLPPKKQQPLADLVDELNRLINLGYLSDFSLPQDRGRNLHAVAAKAYNGPRPDPQIRIGDWFYPTGACRWSVFRGLATSTQVKAMLQATGGSIPATFIMQQASIGPNNPAGDPSNYSLASSMYMLPPRPLAEHGGGFDGLYLVTLVDERYWWQYTSVTIHPTQNSTWASLLNQLSGALGVQLFYSAISPVYGQPEPDSQLWTNVEDANVLLDAVAANIGRTVARNLDGSYSLLTPIESQAIVSANRGVAELVARIAGGDIFNSGTQQLPVGDLTPSRNAVLPASVTVTFPKYVVSDDPVPHFVNSRYAPQRPSTWYEESYGEVYPVTVPLAGTNTPLTSGFNFLTSGLIGVGYSHTIRNTAKALVSGPSAESPNAVPINAVDLSNLAVQITADYYNSQIAAALDEVYPGTYTWVPEGIHDIVWSYSARIRQAATRVMRSQWNQLVKDMQHSAPALPNSTNVPRGVGGPSVAQTIIDSFVNPPGGFLVGTYLTQTLLSGQMQANISPINYLPTDNRWRGQFLDTGEICLFEGTSGGLTGGGFPVNIVYRAIDGTLPSDHANGTPIGQILPNASYGTNVIRQGIAQFIYPAVWTSGGVQGVHIVPQTQSVFASTDNPTTISGLNYYPGTVNSLGAAPVPSQIAIIERNNQPIISGKAYDGQFWGYTLGLTSQGNTYPLYAVNEYNTPLQSGVSSGVKPIGPGIPVLADCLAPNGYQLFCTASPFTNPYLLPPLQMPKVNFASSDNVQAFTWLDSNTPPGFNTQSCAANDPCTINVGFRVVGASGPTQSGRGPFPHNLLSLTHPDTVPFSPPFGGDLVIAQLPIGVLVTSGSTGSGVGNCGPALWQDFAGNSSNTLLYLTESNCQPKWSPGTVELISDNECAPKVRDVVTPIIHLQCSCFITPHQQFDKDTSGESVFFCWDGFLVNGVPAIDQLVFDTGYFSLTSSADTFCTATAPCDPNYQKVNIVWLGVNWTATDCINGVLTVQEPLMKFLPSCYIVWNTNFKQVQQGLLGIPTMSPVWTGMVINSNFVNVDNIVFGNAFDVSISASNVCSDAPCLNHNSVTVNLRTSNCGSAILPAGYLPMTCLPTKYITSVTFNSVTCALTCTYNLVAHCNGIAYSLNGVCNINTGCG